MEYLKYQYHKWIDIIAVTAGAAFEFIKDFFVFVREYDQNQHNLPKITEQKCQCVNCGWSGIVWDCDPDINGEGDLACPHCLEIIEVLG